MIASKKAFKHSSRPHPRRGRRSCGGTTEELNLKKYDELKGQDYSPGNKINTHYTPLACTFEMLESGWRGLKRGDITSALNHLAMCYEILAEEHGENIEKCTKTLHEYGRVLLEWARIERDALAYAMGGFDQGGPEDPEVLRTLRTPEGRDDPEGTR